MAVGDYRVRLPGGAEPRPAGNGGLIFDCWVEVCTSMNPLTWAAIEYGHFDVEVEPGIVASWNNRNQLMAHLANVAGGRGVVAADVSKKKAKSLFPGGTWPVDDQTEAIKTNQVEPK